VERRGGAFFLALNNPANQLGDFDAIAPRHFCGRGIKAAAVSKKQEGGLFLQLRRAGK
jgi:hypothetical protein